MKKEKKRKNATRTMKQFQMEHIINLSPSQQKGRVCFFFKIQLNNEPVLF